MKKFNVIKLVSSICKKYNIKCEDLKHDLVVIALESTKDIEDNETKIQVAYDETVKYINSNSVQEIYNEVDLPYYPNQHDDVLDEIIQRELVRDLLHIMITNPNINTYSDVLTIYNEMNKNYR